MYHRVVKIIIGLIALQSFSLSAQDNEPPLIDFFALMQDAEEVSIPFKVQTSIETQYKIRSIQPYIYLRDKNVLTQLESIDMVSSNFLNMTFEHPPSTDEYLVLHVKYTPRFVIDGKSEAVCIAKFYAKKLFEPFRCDSQTTSLYLLATLIADSENDGSVITANIIQRMVELTLLPDTQSWQNYQGIITVLLNHVAEQADYSTLNLSGQYLKQFRTIVSGLNTHLLSKRRFHIEQLDSILLQHDETMTNVSYRIYMVIDSQIERMENLLPHVHARPTFIKEFFSGMSPFTLLEPESQKLANVNIAKDHVSFIKWPWFDRVSVQFDDQASFFTNEQTVTFPENVTNVLLRPHGKRGRFSRTSLLVKQTEGLPSQPVEVGND